MFGKNKSTGSIEYIVVGLGNPDRKYENTRHNAEDNHTLTQARSDKSPKNGNTVGRA